MVVWLVRHGQSILNRLGRIQGVTDAPLSEIGRRQAGRIAQWAQGHSLWRIYTSDLSRAFETAAIISTATEVPIVPTRLLRERDFYDYEQITYEDLRQNHPDGLSNGVMDYTLQWDWCRFVEADSVVAQRVIQVLRNQWQSEVMLVTHAGVISSFLMTFATLPQGRVPHIPAGGLVRYDPVRLEFRVVDLESQN